MVTLTRRSASKTTYQRETLMPLFGRKKNQPPPQASTRTPSAAAPAPEPKRHRLSPWGLTSGDLLYVEEMRDTGDTGAGDNEDLDELLRNAGTVREMGASFRPVLRVAGSAGREVDTVGFVPRAVSVSEDGGAWAMAAFISHQTMGLPDALDMSAVDGRNMLFNSEMLLHMPNEQAITGRVDGLVNDLAAFGPSVVALTHLPASQEHDLISLEYIGNSSGVLVRTRSDGSGRHVLGALTDVLGSEQLQAHQAGRYVLIKDGSKNRLLDLEGNSLTDLPTALSYAWMPGTATLLCSQVAEGNVAIRLFDASTGQLEDLVPVAAPQPGLDVYRWFPTELAVAPSGDVVCLSAQGPDQAYQELHGSRGRLHRLDLDTGRMEAQCRPFVGDSGRFERGHRRPIFVGSVDAPAFEIADQLASTAQPLATPDLDGATELAWQDAHDLAIKALRSFVDDGRSATDASALAVVVPAAIRTLRRDSPDAFGQMSEWARQVVGQAKLAGVMGSTGDKGIDRLFEGVHAAAG